MSQSEPCPEIEACPYPHTQLSNEASVQNYAGGMAVRCGGCGATGPVFAERQHAIAAWNHVATLARRAAEAAVEECASLCDKRADRHNQRGNPLEGASAGGCAHNVRGMASAIVSRALAEAGRK